MQWVHCITKLLNIRLTGKGIGNDQPDREQCRKGQQDKYQMGYQKECLYFLYLLKHCSPPSLQQ